MGDVIQIASLELRPKLLWRLLYPVCVLCIAVSLAFQFDAWRLVGLVSFLGVSIYVWRDRVIVVDDVVYRRRWMWHQPLLLDDLVEASVESPYLSHGELVLADSRGVRERLGLGWYDNWRPLAGFAAQAVFAGKVPSSPRERKRLRRYLGELDYSRRLPEHEAAGDGDRFAGDERGA